MKDIHFACCSFQAVHSTKPWLEYPWVGGIAVFGMAHGSRRKVPLFIIDGDGQPIHLHHIKKYKLLRKYGAVSLPTGR